MTGFELRTSGAGSNCSTNCATLSTFPVVNRVLHFSYNIDFFYLNITKLEIDRGLEWAIDTVNQGNWCLSIKLRLECFVIVA